MATIKRFEDLEIWQLAREVENKVYEETQRGKLAKDYKLRDQMNNAAGSIMDNIAEEFGRSSRLEFIQFLSISNGFGNELQTQLYRCLDRKYLPDKLCRKIFSFMDYLNKSSVRGQKFANRTASPQHQTPNPKPQI